MMCGQANLIVTQMSSAKTTIWMMSVRLMFTVDSSG
jgi:hypothetical protein